MATSSTISTNLALLANNASHHTYVELPHRSSPLANLHRGIKNLLHINHTTATNHESHEDKRHASIVHASSVPSIPKVPSVRSLTPAFSRKEDISELFPAIHGKEDWSALLDPLDPGLRREIIKYGEFAHATYDAFDYNPFSEYCGSCLFSPMNFLNKLELERHGYTVTKYLYAMSRVKLPQWLERSLHAEAWSRDSNWMGFVAVSGDEESQRIGCRDITVAWRGTVAPAEWYEDLQNQLEPLGSEHGDAKVEHGFHSLYTSKSDSTRYNKCSASEQVMFEINRLVNFYQEKGEKVSLTVTGHSLGGAIALLNAHEVAYEIPDIPISVISFGAPRVGNEAFAHELESLGVKVLRIVVKQDFVPKTPGIIFNEGLKKIKSITGSLDWVYTHVGFELGLDIKNSPYLKKRLDFNGFHSLETHLHLLDGFLGSNSKFRSNAKRDLALVNKHAGILRDEYKVPACWHDNEGAMKKMSRRLKQPNREKDYIPMPLMCL